MYAARWKENKAGTNAPPGCISLLEKRKRKLFPAHSLGSQFPIACQMVKLAEKKTVSQDFSFLIKVSCT